MAERKWIAAFFSIVGLGSLIVPATADDQSASLGPCRQSVSAMHASIRESKLEEIDGRATYLLVVKSNGLDYSVTCDAKSGNVRDVGRLLAP